MKPQKIKRKPNLQTIRTTEVYTVKTFAQTLKRRRETVLRWIRDGMPILSGRTPYLIDGSEAKEWLMAKWLQRKSSCALDELYCLPCHKKTHPAQDSARFIDMPNGTLKIEAVCPHCNGSIHMTRSGTDKEIIQHMMSRFTANVRHLSGHTRPTVNRGLEGEPIKYSKVVKIGGEKS